jgi:hypothetical protein
VLVCLGSLYFKCYLSQQILIDAPTRLKKELDIVLTLQADLDNVSSAIQSAKSQFQASQESPSAISALKTLECTSSKFTENIERLYASLNIHNSFPELNGIDLDFVRILLLARDLKINIQKRAIGSFFEWERLDQAVGGRNQVLGNEWPLSTVFMALLKRFSGTKMHQNTRKAIAKRKPALMAAIRKFNTYCAILSSLYRAEWSIPLPKPLPSQLSTL